MLTYKRWRCARIMPVGRCGPNAIKALVVVAAAVLTTQDAGADLWSRAIASPAQSDSEPSRPRGPSGVGRAIPPDRSQQVYAKEMALGDELVMHATTNYVASRAIVRRLVQRAISSYRNAAQARPREAEPYFRIGRLIYSFFFECGPTVIYQLSPSPLCPSRAAAFDRKRAEEVIDAWDAFESRAPLDPRLSPLAENSSSADFNVLFHRAVLHTHLATPRHLEAAIADYEKLLARSDVVDGTTLANLAETNMMLGRLDEAIDVYRQALRVSRSTETLYGLAVALDRDERGAQAKNIIVAQGKQQMEEFHKRVTVLRLTFFVPYGEEFYYFALASEAFGETKKAIDYWQEYLRSNAHPRFQPRARAHLQTLLAARKRKAPR